MQADKPKWYKWWKKLGRVIVPAEIPGRMPVFLEKPSGKALGIWWAQ
jgi:hypothetical protein